MKGRACSRGRKRNSYTLLVKKPEGERQLGRPRHRWIDKNKTDLAETGRVVVDWIGLAQDMDQCRALVIMWVVMVTTISWRLEIGGD
jgi:hypothetical protein